MFETFYESVKPSIHSPFNCITASIHYVLIHKGFRCIGMNEELFTSVRIPSNIKASELMPEKWNDEKKKISLIYKGDKGNGHLLLKVAHTGELAHAHLMRNTDQQTSELSLPYKEHVGSSFAQYDKAYTDLDGLLTLIERRLVDPLFGGGVDGGGYGKKKQGPSTDPPPRFNPPPPGHPSPYPTNPLFRPPTAPIIPPILPCGRTDLDPFGQCNPPIGGMMFDPLGMYRARPQHQPNLDPSHIPDGSVPPGARFDPLNPLPGPGGIFGPDPDDMPRPNFDDPFNF